MLNRRTGTGHHSAFRRSAGSERFPAPGGIAAKQCIFVKDEDGLYTDNPKVASDVKFIPKVGAKELLDMDLDDLIVERGVLEMMQNARNVTQIQIINGLKEGNITRALTGEHVGTIIYKD
ncbi:MAG TPA: hypothetical protein DEA44_07115 [Firmicutes bacterium]|nr:hypothetical protein [Bacillota bacterium]